MALAGAVRIVPFCCGGFFFLAYYFSPPSSLFLLFCTPHFPQKDLGFKVTVSGCARGTVWGTGHREPMTPPTLEKGESGKGAFRSWPVSPELFLLQVVLDDVLGICSAVVSLIYIAHDFKDGKNIVTQSLQNMSSLLGITPIISEDGSPSARVCEPFGVPALRHKAVQCTSYFQVNIYVYHPASSSLYVTDSR